LLEEFKLGADGGEGAVYLRGVWHLGLVLLSFALQMRCL
jgi:hypothetical protein